MNDLPHPPQWNARNAAAFSLTGVVASYHLRAPYPSRLMSRLLDLMHPPGGKVLELGCGTGEIARSLAPSSERVDAVDVSAPMLARAPEMPGGDHPAIRWLHAGAEEAPLRGPYALAIAGDSLHWMTWEVVLPRVRDALAAGAYLAIVRSVTPAPPWSDELLDVIRRYSVIQDFVSYNLIEELEKRGLFESTGAESIAAEPYRRSIDEYIRGLHATSGLAAERMGAEASRTFDDAVEALVAPFARDGIVELSGGAELTWGWLRET